MVLATGPKRAAAYSGGVWLARSFRTSIVYFGFSVIEPVLYQLERARYSAERGTQNAKRIALRSTNLIIGHFLLEVLLGPV